MSLLLACFLGVLSVATWLGFRLWREEVRREDRARHALVPRPPAPIGEDDEEAPTRLWTRSSVARAISGELLTSDARNRRPW